MAGTVEFTFTLTFKNIFFRTSSKRAPTLSWHSPNRSTMGTSTFRVRLRVRAFHSSSSPSLPRRDWSLPTFYRVSRSEVRMAARSRKHFEKLERRVEIFGPKDCTRLQTGNEHHRIGDEICCSELEPWLGTRSSLLLFERFEPTRETCSVRIFQPFLFWVQRRGEQARSSERQHSQKWIWSKKRIC